MLPLEWKYPPELLAVRARAAAQGTLREKIRFDLAGRAAYAWGLLAAADAAKFFGFRTFSAIEFGVAEGAGLIEMARLARLVTNETGISIRVFGLDNGTGLPEPAGYRDHPEVWSGGDFAMGDPRALRAVLPAGTQLFIGSIAEMLPNFLASIISEEAPIGFCSFDVDIHSSSVAALEVYANRPELYLPVGIAYCDDTLGGAGSIGSLMRNRKAGQLLAIDEFNARYPARAIDEIRTLKHRQPLNREQWLEQIYGVHVLDHPLRNQPRRTNALSMQEHGTIDWLRWPP
jgi:hypothetical protein